MSLNPTFGYSLRKVLVLIYKTVDRRSWTQQAWYLGGTHPEGDPERHIHAGTFTPASICLPGPE